MSWPDTAECGACTHLKRECGADCFYCPYYPPCDGPRFAVVDTVFGAGNVDMLLAELKPKARGKAIYSIEDEATKRKDDPAFDRAAAVIFLRNMLSRARARGEAVAPAPAIQPVDAAVAPSVALQNGEASGSTGKQDDAKRRTYAAVVAGSSRAPRGRGRMQNQMTQQADDGAKESRAKATVATEQAAPAQPEQHAPVAQPNQKTTQQADDVAKDSRGKTVATEQPAVAAEPPQDQPVPEPNQQKTQVADDAAQHSPGKAVATEHDAADTKQQQHQPVPLPNQQATKQAAYVPPPLRRKAVTMEQAAARPHQNQPVVTPNQQTTQQTVYVPPALRGKEQAKEQRRHGKGPAFVGASVGHGHQTREQQSQNEQTALEQQMSPYQNQQRQPQHANLTGMWQSTRQQDQTMVQVTKLQEHQNQLRMAQVANLPNSNASQFPRGYRVMDQQMIQPLAVLARNQQMMQELARQRYMAGGQQHHVQADHFQNMTRTLQAEAVGQQHHVQAENYQNMIRTQQPLAGGQQHHVQAENYQNMNGTQQTVAGGQQDHIQAENYAAMTGTQQEVTEPQHHNYPDLPKFTEEQQNMWGIREESVAHWTSRMGRSLDATPFHPTPTRPASAPPSLSQQPPQPWMVNAPGSHEQPSWPPQQPWLPDVPHQPQNDGGDDEGESSDFPAYYYRFMYPDRPSDGW